MFENLSEHNKVAFYTNLIYGIVALFIVNFTGWIGIPLALSLLYLMVGSGYYHYYERHKYVWFDWSAMYMVFCTQIAVFLYHLFGSNTILLGDLHINYVWGDAIIIGILLSVFHNKLDKLKWHGAQIPFVIIGILYSINVILSVFVLPTLFAIVAFCLFSIGFLLRQEGESIKHKNEKLHDRLHGAWHILTGIGILILNLIKL